MVNMRGAVIRGVAAEIIREEAARRGMGVEEYILELVAQNLDPAERASEYVEAAVRLLGEAEEELRMGDVRQAAGRVWGAAALAVKAYAEAVEGRRLTSHRELWEYAKKLAENLGDWAYDAWMAAQGMHTCFHEGWCTKWHVEEALRRVRRLVEAVKEALQHA